MAEEDSMNRVARPRGAFGLWDECDSLAQVAWGARAIYSPGSGFSLVHDRQGFWGDKGLINPFLDLLNDGRLGEAKKNCQSLVEDLKMQKDKSETFVIFEDDRLVIKANTRASYGYVYLIAYPKSLSFMEEAG